MVAWNEWHRTSLLNLSNHLVMEEDSRSRGCHNRWCTSKLPAYHSIPVPDSPPPPNALFVKVCDNCYLDYESGIESYSWKG